MTTLRRHFFVGRSETTVCGAKQYGTRDPEKVTCPRCLPSARAIAHTNALESEMVAVLAVCEGLRALGERERGPCPFQVKCDDDCGHD